MHVFHSRLVPSGHEQPLPLSLWAKEHATEVLEWGTVIKTISDSRTKLVNFVALQEAVERCMGQACTAIEWVGEGGCNQIYLIFLADGSQLIARISFPFPHEEQTGEAFAHQTELDRSRIPTRLQSEVATIRYVQKHTEIPVARVYAYESSLSNPVGAPYTLQEVLKGDLLANRWNDMTLDERYAIIRSLGRISGKLYSLVFGSYGSLKFDRDQISLGPLTEPIESLHRHLALHDRGPWSPTDPTAPLLGLAVRERQWLSSPEGRQLFTAWRRKMHPEEDPVDKYAAFSKLTEGILELIPYLTTIFPLPVEASKPSLAHPDFHFSNVLVSHDDPTCVTGVVDWEFCSILPLWMAYSVPGKIVDGGDELEKDPIWRDTMRRLREVYNDALVEEYPDAAIAVIDSRTEQSIRGIRLVRRLATSGVALYRSCQVVRRWLTEARDCAVTQDSPGFDLLNRLVSLFPQSV